VKPGKQMSANPSDWPLPHFQMAGGKSCLFFVVYGRFGSLPSLSGMNKSRGSDLENRVQLAIEQIVFAREYTIRLRDQTPVAVGLGNLRVVSLTSPARWAI